MIIVKDKKCAINFRVFKTMNEAKDFIAMIPKKHRSDYIIVK